MPKYGCQIKPRLGGTHETFQHTAFLRCRRISLHIAASSNGVVITGGNRGFG